MHCHTAAVLSDTGEYEASPGAAFCIKEEGTRRESVSLSSDSSGCSFATGVRWGRAEEDSAATAGATVASKMSPSPKAATVGVAVLVTEAVPATVAILV